VLFDFADIARAAVAVGINTTRTTIPVSETLTATVSLDPTFSHFFDMHADAEAQAFNIAEPGSLSLLLAGLAALAWRRRGGATQITRQTRISRHS
jgi:hypothetical protein